MAGTRASCVWHDGCTLRLMAGALQNLDWNLLKTFRSVADAGSVSAAARALHREQPSVSAALKRLENHVGFPLCRRSSRGIDLTAAGEAVLQTTRDIERSIEDLAAEIGAVQDAADTTLVLRMISDVMSPSLDRALASFHKAYPCVDVRIEIAPWRAVLQSVRANEAMLGVACDNAPSDDLTYKPLLYEAQQLYCGASHPLFGVPAQAPDRLSDEAFVSTGDDEPEQLLQFRLANGLGRRSCGTAETLHEARKLIKMGFGVGFLPTVVAEASNEALWPLLRPEILPRYPLYVVTHRAAPRTPRARQLLAALLAEIGEPDFA
jgi:LysR family transcriptional regulator, transcriptional activator for bauABCD operon